MFEPYRAHQIRRLETRSVSGFRVRKRVSCWWIGFCRGVDSHQHEPSGGVSAATGLQRSRAGIEQGSGCGCKGAGSPAVRPAAPCGPTLLPGDVVRHDQPLWRGSLLHHRGPREVGARHPTRAREGRDGLGPRGGPARRAAAGDRASAGHARVAAGPGAHRGGRTVTRRCGAGTWRGKATVGRMLGSD